MTRLDVLAILIIGTSFLSGCATSSYRQPVNVALSQNDKAMVPQTGSAVARAALNLLGTPYRYGGNNRDGFDCSGLVQFAHAQVGLQLPRTTATQFAAAQQVSDQPRAGDVLFFRINGRVSHNGIYLGDNRFVHAPSTGKNVSVTRIDNPYFRKRLVGFRRFR